MSWRTIHQEKRWKKILALLLWAHILAFGTTYFVELRNAEWQNVEIQFVDINMTTSLIVLP
jgi:hypothetical protein